MPLDLRSRGHKNLKNGKSPGFDNIYAEMLKADTVTSANILLHLFVTIWEDKTLPSDWRKGLIVKLAKLKGRPSDL